MHQDLYDFLPREYRAVAVERHFLVMRVGKIRQVFELDLEAMRQFLDKSAGSGRAFSIDHKLAHPSIVDFNNLGILAADIDNRVRPFELQQALCAEEMCADFGQLAVGKFNVVPAVARCDQSVIFPDAFLIIRQR